MMKGMHHTVWIVTIMLAAAIFSRVAGAAECQEPVKAALKPGTKVVAALAGPNWQEARIDSVSGSTIMVTYPDGGKGSLSPKEVVALPHGAAPCFKQGDKVVARAERDIWRTAKIVEVEDKGAVVQFLDKNKQTRKFSEIVRFPR